MTRRLTSFLLGLVAAVLLTVPANAADVKLVRKTAKAGVIHGLKKQQIKQPSVQDVAKKKAAELKLQDITEQQRKQLEANLENPYVGRSKAPWFPVKSVQVADSRLVKGSLASKRHLDVRAENRFDAATAAANARPQQRNIEKLEVVTDEHGIVTAVSGNDSKFFKRSGTAYYPEDYQIYYEEQGGYVELIFSPTGDEVYIKDPVSHFNQGTWVKGTIDNNTISVAAGQPLAWSNRYQATLSLNWGDYNDNTDAGFNRLTTETITFTIDGDVITLEGSNEDLYIGIFWDDDDTFQGYGDYETVWTYNEGYEPPSTDLIVLPADATVENWYAEGTGSAAVPTDVKVAFVGDQVYVSGLSQQFPESWIQGTLEGTTVTFKSLQYQGNYQDYDIWALGAELTNGTLTDTYTMTYDALAGTLTLDEGQILVFNASDSRLYYLSYIDALTIYKEKPAPTTISAPYTADFSTEAPMADFLIIDNNGDESTWGWDSSNFANYRWNSSNAADDYLILPIKLEANKNYTVTVNVAAGMSSYPEKFEVVAGTAPNAAALTTNIIAPTTVTTSDFTDYEGSLTTTEAGIYYVAIHAISDADQYRLKVAKFSVEIGAEGTAPAPATNLTVTPLDDVLGATISFTAPTTTIDGGTLSTISKVEVYRDNKVIGTLENVAPGSAQTYVDEASDLTIGNHTYFVLAYNADGAGAKSEEVTAFLSAVLTVPYIADFTQPGTIEAFNVIDNNNDGSSWRWSETKYAYYNYNSYNAGDDYLVSSPISLKAGVNYSVTVVARANGYTESFEVVYGSKGDAASLTNVIIPTTVVENEEFEEYAADFTVAADGNYYVAIHANSPSDQFNLIVSQLSIEKGLLPDAPAAPQLAVEAGAQGALSAEISLTAPATSIDGNTLPASNLTRIDLLRDGSVINSFTANPGATINTTDNDVESGLHTYQAIPYDANGDAGQKSEKVQVFVGEDELNYVQNVHVASSDATSFTLAWDEVTGLNGGYVNTANVQYTVVSLEVIETIFGPMLDEGEVLATTDGATTATISYPMDEGEQDYIYVGVKAANASGETDPTYSYTYILVGAPDELPIIEGFADQKLHYNWDSNGGMGVSNESTDGDGVALKLYAYEAGPVYFVLEKVNLNTAANPTLIFDVRSGNVNQVITFGSADGAEIAPLAQANVTEQYTTVKAPLASIKGQRYSTVGILANFAVPSITAYEDTLVIDNIRIVDLYEYDLSVALDGPKSVNAGETATLKITVKNEGEFAANGYTVKLSANGEEVLTKTVNQSLQAWTEETHEFNLETSVFDEGNIVLSAEVEFANDLNEDNNVAEAIVEVKASTAATPENVIAKQDKDKVVITWTAPDSATEYVTENFQDYANGANDNGLVGEWTLVNNSGATKGGLFQDLTLANDGKILAWEVFKPAEYGVTNDEFAGPNGSLDEAYLISAYGYNPDTEAYVDNDDWIISPELPGISQVLSFNIKAFQDYATPGCPIGYKVYYSTTDKELASFIELAADEITTADWQDVSVILPEGTKYFAIVNVSDGEAALLMCVGNISYQVGGGEVAGYKIYADEELLAQVDNDVFSYEVSLSDLARRKSFAAPVVTQHKFAVSAVYVSGRESKPVVTVIDITTAINEILATGKPVDIYTLDGKLVGRQVKSTNGMKGAYIVNDQKVILK